MAADDTSIEVITINANYGPGARRNVISESSLWDVCRARVLKEPDMFIHFTVSGRRVRIMRRGGLYFMRMRLMTREQGLRALADQVKSSQVKSSYSTNHLSRD